MKLLIPAVFLSVFLMGCGSVQKPAVFCASESAALPDTDFVQSDFPCESDQIYVLCPEVKPFCSATPSQAGPMHTMFEPVTLHLEALVVSSISCMFRYEIEGNMSDEDGPDLDDLADDLAEEDFERNMGDM